MGISWDVYLALFGFLLGAGAIGMGWGQLRLGLKEMIDSAGA